TGAAGFLPLSILIYNTLTDDWEAIPIGPVIDGAYNENDLNLWGTFWKQPTGGWQGDTFRPYTATLTNTRTATISFGNTFPHSISESTGEITFDDTIGTGGNFLINNPGDSTVQLYGDYKVDNLIRYYSPNNFKSNLINLKGLVIRPDNFFTSNSYFPLLDNSVQFELRQDFNNYMDNNGEFKFRILSTLSPTMPATLCVGTFKTYSLAKTDNLNYDNFESNLLSDHIKVTNTGLELNGTSGIKMVSKGTPSQEEIELETLISPNPYSFDASIIIGESNLNSPKETYDEDGTYWIVDSKQENNDNKAEIEFKIEIPKNKIEGVKRFEIQMNAISSVSLGDQYF
ncbi:hypothetical protein LCGC14_3115100, partial [marine sediment metagenome]